MMHFVELVVREVRKETDDAVSVAFELPESLSDAFRHEPGQYLTLRTLVDGEDVRRTYSICSAPHERPLRVAIKHVPNGRFSTFANERLAAGAVLQVLPPIGRFTVPIRPDDARHHVAFAAGSGITPIMSLIKALLREEPRSHVTLCYGNRSVSSILFRDELCDLKDRYLGRLTVHHFLSQQSRGVPLYRGRLDGPCVAELLRTLLPAERIDTAMVCGPDTMIDDTVAALQTHGVDAAAIVVERFGAPASPMRARTTGSSATPPGAAPRTADVTLDGVQTTLTLQPHETLLDAAMRAGLELPFACRGGVCATCRACVVQGEVEMQVNYALAPWELEAGFTLTCQARPTTRHVAVDFDQS